MEVDPRDKSAESSEDEADTLDNYGVFQSDFEFKFVQEGNDKTTLMLPPVTYDSMEVKYFNIEIEVDSELPVSALEKEETENGTTRYFFRIAKTKLHLDQSGEGVSFEQLGEDGYDYENFARPKNKKRKAKTQRALMDAHNYSKLKDVTGQETSDMPHKKQPAETIKPKIEALDGTEIDEDPAEIGDEDHSGKGSLAEGEMHDDDDDMDDDGDDDMDDFDETELGDNMTFEEGEDEEASVATSKRKKPKMKSESTSGKKRRKYTRTNHYSKDSSNFTVELTDEGEKIYKCGFCDYRSKSSGNACSHVRIHTKEKPFRCTVCHKSFRREDSLATHMFAHTNERNCMCEKCGTFFKCRKGVYDHIRNVHKTKKLKCQDCGKCFSNNFKLAQHTNVHTGEKNYQCTVCHFTVSHSSSLKRHMLTHTGEQKFHCHVCEKRFNRKEYFRTHMMKCHNFNGAEDFLAKTRIKSDYSQNNSNIPLTRKTSGATNNDNVYTIDEVVLSVIKEEKADSAVS